MHNVKFPEINSCWLSFQRVYGRKEDAAVTAPALFRILLSHSDSVQRACSVKPCSGRFKT